MKKDYKNRFVMIFEAGGMAGGGPPSPKRGGGDCDRTW